MAVGSYKKFVGNQILSPCRVEVELIMEEGRGDAVGLLLIGCVQNGNPVVHGGRSDGESYEIPRTEVGAEGGGGMEEGVS